MPASSTMGDLCVMGWADAAQRGEARFRVDSFRIVASGQQELGSRLLSNRVARQKIWGQLLDNGADHHVQVGNLIVQLKIAPAQRLETDPVGRCNVAIVRQIGSPGGQRPDQLHARHISQRLAQFIRRADDRILNELQGHLARRDGRLAADLEDYG